MRLRRGNPADLSFVYLLERRYIEDSEGDHLAQWQNSVGRHLDQWVSALPRMTVAEVHGDRAGYLFWELAPAKAVLASVAVEPSHRRRGIASALLRSFEAEARQAGLPVAELGVLNGNPARHLYETHGYEPSGLAGRYTLMTKHL